MADQQQVRKNAEEYYSKAVQHTEDLKTNACCAGSKRPPTAIAAAIAQVHDEVCSKYYGCGLTIPTDDLTGLTVLDLGSGAGRDCFVLSKLVGEHGHVHGVDMTDAQLAVANKYVPYHTQLFKYASPNVEFHKGFIEKLDMIPSSSVDLIISNCVVNLSPDKDSVLSEAFRVLKNGGEMYFSDVYSDRRIAPELMKDPVLHGECLSGALYWNDFLRLARRVGFADARLVEDHVISIGNKDIKQKLGAARFFSATYRLFKIPGLESDCEDYGQAVIYQGTIPGSADQYAFDGHHVMETGKVFPVCGNTYRMLHDSRLAKHFQFMGTWDKHFGVYSDCGKNVPFKSASESSPKGRSDAGSCCGGGSCC